MSPEYIQVPVPIDRVQEVYELLARPRVSADSPAADAIAGRPQPWSDELLVHAYEDSPEAMKKLLDTLAERHDQTVTMDELAGVLGLERGQVAGVLGAFSRRWKNRYRQGDGNLPYKAFTLSSAGMRAFSMSGPVAAAFERARGPR